MPDILARLDRERRMHIAVVLRAEQHMTVRAIADVLHVSHATIVRDLQRHAREDAEEIGRILAGELDPALIPPTQWLTPSERGAARRSVATRRKHAKRLREQFGLSQRQIARQLDVSAATINRDLRHS